MDMMEELHDISKCTNARETIAGFLEELSLNLSEFQCS